MSDVKVLPGVEISLLRLQLVKVTGAYVVTEAEDTRIALLASVFPWDRAVAR